MNKQEAIKTAEFRVIYPTEVRPNLEVLPLEEVKNIISQIHEPQKPVVPKFVAEWIEELKKNHSNLAWVWQVYPNESKVKNWLEANTEKFMRAWLDGFEVETEKLYTVEIPSPNRTTEPTMYLSRDERGKIFLNSWFLPGQNWKKHPHSHLTEAEIKQDFEWAWDAGFAKPVEEK